MTFVAKGRTHIHNFDFITHDTEIAILASGPRTLIILSYLCACGEKRPMGYGSPEQMRRLWRKMTRYIRYERLKPAKPSNISTNT